MITGKEIKANRKTAGLTQKELADLAGVSLTALNQFERGHKSINLTTANKLMAVLGGDKEIKESQVNEDFLVIAHKLTSLSEVLKDPGITPETKNSELEAFIKYYLMAGNPPDSPKNKKQPLLFFS